MATVKVTLRDGLKLGEVPQLEVEFKQLNMGEILAATMEGQQAHLLPTGLYELLPSDILTGVHIVRRQIVRIGDIPGDPLPLETWGLLSERDGAAIQAHAVAFSGAALETAKETAQVGEDGAGPDGT